MIKIININFKQTIHFPIVKSRSSIDLKIKLFFKLYKTIFKKPTLVFRFTRGYNNIDLAVIQFFTFVACRRLELGCESEDSFLLVKP